MIKKISLTLLLLAISTQLLAHEESQEESKYYVVLKGSTILGDTFKEEKGNSGYGLGVDLGYRLEYGFSVEYDFSYSKNQIESATEKVDADYITHAIDVVYTYEALENLGVFAKIGAEYEKETIDNASESSNGYVVGAGFEYAINHDYSLVSEYEHSSIDGTRGDSIYLGLMYNF